MLPISLQMPLQALLLFLSAFALALGGCDSVSSSASTSNSNSSVLALKSSVGGTTVLDGTTVLTPGVTLDVEGALGDVGYRVVSEPEVTWFAVSAGGTLTFDSFQRAFYDDEALGSVVDAGEGKSIELTITAVDAGRAEDNTVSVTVLVRVIPREFGLKASPAAFYVRHGEAALSEFLLLSAVFPRGEVSYRVAKVSPAVDWLALDEEGLLNFGGRTANYDDESLTQVDDDGEGKPIELTILATDSGRPKGANEATATVTVRVLPPPFELSASPSSVTLNSGSNRLNASNQVRIALANPEYLLGKADYALAVNAEGDWFEIENVEADSAAILSLKRVLDYNTLSDVPQYGIGKVLQVQVTMVDSGRSMAESAEEVIDVVVTLTKEIASLWLDADRVLSSVTHGADTLSEDISFTPNALGVMSYTVTTEPEVDWFTIAKGGENGVLRFKDGKSADYSELTSSAGAVYPLKVTVTGTDAGRTKENEASVAITLDVQQLPVELSVTPEVTSLTSGTTSFASTPVISGKHGFGRVRYSIESVSPPLEWFAIDPVLGTLSLVQTPNYFAPALNGIDDPDLDGDGTHDGKAVHVRLKLEALDRLAGNESRKTLTVRVKRAETLSLLPSAPRTRVQHKESTLAPEIAFTAQGVAPDSASYALDASTTVDWIAVDPITGALSIPDAEAVDYAAIPGAGEAGIREVMVTVRVTAGGEEEVASVVVEVERVGAFQIAPNAEFASVIDGESALSSAVVILAENNVGEVTYSLSAIVPALNWFRIDASSGELEFEPSATAAYADVTTPDFGDGKPVDLTVEASDTVSMAKVVMQVRVQPPELSIAVDPSPASVDVQHAARALDVGVSVQVGGAIGALVYEVTTETGPAVDWFGVKPSTGALYVRPDRAVDWDALPGSGAGGVKTLLVRVTATDLGRNSNAEIASEVISLNVQPAPFSLKINRAVVPLADGSGEQESTGVAFSSDTAVGSIVYSEEPTTFPPDLGWFAVVETSDAGSGVASLTVAKDKTIRYGDAALAEIVDSGEGKAVYVTVEATDTRDTAETSDDSTSIASVIVYVQPPPFQFNPSRWEVGLRDRGSELEEEVSFIVEGAVGTVTYQVSTVPALDPNWFQASKDGLTLAYATDVRREPIPSGEIKVDIVATDTGRSQLVIGYQVKRSVTVVLLERLSGSVWIEMSATRAEFLEREGQLEPNLDYAVRELPADSSVSVRLSGDVTLCSRGGCAVGIVFDEHEQGKPGLSSEMEGSLKLQVLGANFWATKYYYEWRGDNASLPLYVNLRAETTGSQRTTLAERELLFVMKNLPNDERLVIGDQHLLMPEGDGNDPFFFPISALEIPLPANVQVEIDSELFRLRNVEMLYVQGELDIEEVSFFGASSFKPCSAPYHCSKTVGSPDWRLALQEGVELTYDEAHAAANFHTITATLSVIDAAPGFETAEVELVVEIVDRQDGTPAHPFLIDGAGELLSIGVEGFRNDYTERMCGALPTCSDGKLAGFETLVAHYQQTDDIDLPSVVFPSIGDPSGGEAIAFHGNYNGGGYTIGGLSAPLFDTLGASAVIEDVHLVDVSIQEARETGGLIRQLERGFSSDNEGAYMSQRFHQLNLPYYDFHFAVLWDQFWDRFDIRDRSLLPPQVIASSVTGSVSGEGFAGGIAGVLRGGKVLGSYSTATVEAAPDGDGNSYAGGLIGGMLDDYIGLIGASFATGDVAADVAGGGLVGLHAAGRVSTSFATGVPAARAERHYRPRDLPDATPALGALIGDHRSILRDAYGLGLTTLVGRTADDAITERVYGVADGIEAWDCDTALFHWNPTAPASNDPTCSGYTQDYLYGWDFGDAQAYPAPNYNALSPEEIRDLAWP